MRRGPFSERGRQVGKSEKHDGHGELPPSGRGTGTVKDRNLPLSVESFRALILGHYRERGRDLPWRNTRDPYRIFVSEMMLQQTQVSRVLLKYPAFVSALPSFSGLREAGLEKILSLWGLGYNRRCVAMKKSAAIICAHNHPSSDCSPSSEDVAVTRQIVEAGKLLDVECLDHLVIGKQRFVSLRERGLGF